MGQSLVKNYLHIVFSTKYRQPLIQESIEEELYSYLGGICNNLECHVIKVGGYTDHIHILCMLSKKVALMKLLEELKSHSSKWIKTKRCGLCQFLMAKRVRRVIQYIANQKEHHRKKAFKTEYQEFLEKNEVAYDQR